MEHGIPIRCISEVTSLEEREDAVLLYMGSLRRTRWFEGDQCFLTVIGCYKARTVVKGPLWMLTFPHSQRNLTDRH